MIEPESPVQESPVQDYPVEALKLLLDASCLMDRYAPLIPYRDELISGLLRLGCKRKSDAERLPDDALMQLGLSCPELIRLFRRFLTIYDAKPQKWKEIPAVTSDPEMQAAFSELYYLPGVKRVRAELYYRSGYRSLAALAAAAPEDVIARTARTIADEQLACIAPLPKEVRTHIAVARAFTGL